MSSNQNPSKRIDFFDFAKGLALIGVFAGNSSRMNGPFYLCGQQITNSMNFWLDNFFAGIIHIFFEVEVNSIFFYIFGFASYMLLQKIELNWIIYFKRMIILFLIGIVHASIAFFIL